MTQTAKKNSVPNPSRSKKSQLRLRKPHRSAKKRSQLRAGAPRPGAPWLFPVRRQFPFCLHGLHTRAGVEDFLEFSFENLGIKSAIDLPIYQRVASVQEANPGKLTVTDAMRTGDTGSAQVMEEAMQFVRDMVAQKDAFLALVVSKEMIWLPGGQPFEAVLFNLDHKTLGRHMWFAPIQEGGTVEQQLIELPTLATTTRGLPPRVFPRHKLVDLHTPSGVDEFLRRIGPGLGIGDTRAMPVLGVFVSDFDSANPKPGDPMSTIVTWPDDTDGHVIDADIERHVRQTNALMVVLLSKASIRAPGGEPQDVVLVRLLHRDLGSRTLFARVLEDGTMDRELVEPTWLPDATAEGLVAHEPLTSDGVEDILQRTPMGGATN